MEGDELLFELRGPDGHAWRLYLDGRTEGFPDGTMVVNSALPMVWRMIVGMAGDAESVAKRVESLYRAAQDANIYQSK